MNWINYAFIFIITTIVLPTSIEARGGRGGGGGRSSSSHSSGSRSSGSRSSGSSSSGSSSSHSSSSHSSSSHSSSSGSKSSGSGGGGGGFSGSIFGGSSSSSKTSSFHSSPPSSSSFSSSSNWKPSQQPSYNPYSYYQHKDNSFGSKSSGSSQSSSSLSDWKPYQHSSYNSNPYYPHTVNYDNIFGSSPRKAADSTDYLTGFMAGNLLSNHHKVYNSVDNGYIYPRLSFMENNEPESTTTGIITTAMETELRELLNVLNEYKNHPNDLNSLNSNLARISNINLSKDRVPAGTVEPLVAIPSTTETLVTTPSTTNEMPTNPTELPQSTTESTTMISESASSIPQKQHTHVEPNIAIPHNDNLLSSTIASPSETLPTTTESTQEANLDISTPYGVICSPIVYNEVNEFGVNLIIEKLACYPALEPVAPLE